MIGTVAFFIYLAALAYFLFFSDGLGREDNMGYRYNLIPFLEIRRFWENRDSMGNGAFILNVILNMVAFLPMGFFLPLITRHKVGVVKTTFITLGFSLIIECVQLMYRVGSFDVDDLILNTFGGLVGAVIYYIMRQMYRTGYSKRYN